MIDLFVIFGKGGIVLWCFQETSQLLCQPVNALIKSVLLQERGGNNSFNHEALSLQYKLDNEFELVFVVGYQKTLQLSYLDKLLTDIQIEFRDKFRQDLTANNMGRNYDFQSDFMTIWKQVEMHQQKAASKPRQMKSYDQSEKSKKTVSSMVISGKNKDNNKTARPKKANEKTEKTSTDKPTPIVNGIDLDAQKIEENRANFMKRMIVGKGKKNDEKSNGIKNSPDKVKRVKQGTRWDKCGKSDVELNRSDDIGLPGVVEIKLTAREKQLKGLMGGGLKDLIDTEFEQGKEEEEEGEDEDEAEDEGETKKPSGKKLDKGFFSSLRNLVRGKKLTADDLEPTLAKMKDHLISKNVAAEISEKICQSISVKLEGKVLGTFTTIASTIKQSLYESCVQILSPKRRIDILRDALDMRSNGRPYTIVFCGVNGVGKSTNLAKVCFWLIENGLRVQIAACDTFRAGAVEQLRTHVRKLEALHPEMVHLYEKGYGKDAAGIAMEAISNARDTHHDVVLIDTAGRMQDNEPLMRSLAKLMKINLPDLVLFVGEALVGNDAIDQLTKFNQALADHSQMESPRLIDGIVLTKFDTIDDKVGAAVSMTYTTGQPIVFVGTGQTYTDLKNLNAKAVVNSLLKA